MNKFFKQILILISLVSILILPYFVFAKSSAQILLEDVGSGAGGGYKSIADADGNTRISTIVGTVVGAFLSLLGVIFIILILYGGFLWMTARGDEVKVEKSIATIKRAIVGLLIVLLSYGIYNFIYVQVISK